MLFIMRNKEEKIMFYENTMNEALEDMQHGVETGSIVFQMPEDEKMIAGIMVALKRQIPKVTTVTQELMEVEYICPECDCINRSRFKFCWNCGQSIIHVY